MGVVKQRDIVVAIILSIVTCGIYGIYWTICLVNEVNCLCDELRHHQVLWYSYFHL